MAGIALQNRRGLCSVLDQRSAHRFIGIIGAAGKSLAIAPITPVRVYRLQVKIMIPRAAIRATEPPGYARHQSIFIYGQFKDIVERAPMPGEVTCNASA